MIDWLQRKGIAHDDKVNRKQLYEIVKLHRPPKNLILEGLLKGTEHEIVWLPPYHAFFNPIELIWGLVKRYFDSHVGRNHDYSKETMIKIFEEALASITPQVWAKTVELVEARILKAIDEELCNDGHDPNFRMVISLESDDDSESGYDDDDYDPDDPAEVPHVQNTVTATFKSKEEQLMGIDFSDVMPHTSLPPPVEPIPEAVKESRRRLFFGSFQSINNEDHGMSPVHCMDDEVDNASVGNNFSEGEQRMEGSPFHVEDTMCGENTVIKLGVELAQHVAEFQPVDQSFSLAWSLLSTRCIFQQEIDNAVRSIENLLQGPESTNNYCDLNISDTYVEETSQSMEISYTDPQVSRVTTTLFKLAEMDDDAGVQLKSGVIIAAKVIKSMLPFQWMSPKIIDIYFGMLMKKHSEIYAFPVSFYEHLNSNDAIDNDKYSKIDFSQWEVVFIPVHLGLYWCLCVVKPKDKSIVYYDSMQRKHQECLQEVRKYLQQCHLSVNGTEMNWSGWSSCHEVNVMVNHDHVMCSVLIAAYARRIIECSPCDFDITHIESFRAHMMDEVLSGKLKTFHFSSRKQVAEKAESLPIRSDSTPVNLEDALVVFGAKESQSDIITLYYESPLLALSDALDTGVSPHNEKHPQSDVIVLSDNDEIESGEVPLYNDSNAGSLEDTLKLPDGTLLVTCCQYKVRVMDLRTLSGTTWLNDEVINFYFCLLRMHFSNDSSASVQSIPVQFLDSHFYTTLLKHSDRVDSWYNHGKLLDVTTTFIPIHLETHWCLCLVRSDKKTITYYDSKGGRNTKGMEVVKSYLIRYAQRHGIPSIKWKIFHATNILPQIHTDSYNCGVFICWYARRILEGKSCSIAGEIRSDEMMARFRNQISHEILRRRLTVQEYSFESDVQKVRNPQFVMYPPPSSVNIRSDVGTGLQNMGSTCYLNSILQILLHNNAFVTWLLHDVGHSCKDCFTCALSETLQDTINKSLLTVVEPSMMVKKVSELSHLFLPGAENDAHEFLRLLLSKLQEEYTSRFQHLQLDIRSKETTPINTVFGGYLRTEVTCLNCHNISLTLQQFMDISVDVAGHTNLDACLKAFFAPEKIAGYRCDECEMVVDVSRQYFLEIPPSTLCVHFKRFGTDGGKLDHIVYVKPTLNTTQFMHRSQKKRTVYKLQSVVVHRGTKNTGHYYAICSAGKSGFFQFNDSTVKKSSLNNCMSEEVYVALFDMMLNK